MVDNIWSWSMTVLPRIAHNASRKQGMTTDHPWAVNGCPRMIIWSLCGCATWYKKVWIFTFSVSNTPQLLQSTSPVSCLQACLFAACLLLPDFSFHYAERKEEKTSQTKTWFDNIRTRFGKITKTASNFIVQYSERDQWILDHFDLVRLHIMCIKGRKLTIMNLISTTPILQSGSPQSSTSTSSKVGKSCSI